MKVKRVSYFTIIRAIIYSTRPSATLGTCLLTLAAFNPQKSELTQSLLLVVSMFFASAYCFLINDIYDRKKDLLNDKKRPIATGVVPLQVAIGTAVSFALIMGFTSWFLGMNAFLLSLAFLIGTTYYSYINARTGLFANVIVSLTVAGTQWGVWFIKPDDVLLISGFYLFFFSIPREMMLDWLDMPGDKAYGKPSFPMNHSLMHVNTLIIFCLILCSGLIYFFKLSNLSSGFIIFSMISGWFSFIPFFRNADNDRALLTVRLSHITFALLILALFTR